MPSHNRKGTPSYNQQKRDYKKDEVLRTCRCPMCEPGQDLHKKYIYYTGRAAIPIKYCLAHEKYLAHQGADHTYRVEL